jgi:glycosyltransferase involved in cell wall biosynthesis
MKPLVLVTGPPATRSGYGAHTRDLIHSLIGMDRFDIHINSLRWGNTPMNALNIQNPKDKLIIDRLLTQNSMERQPDIHFQVSVPNEFTPIGKYNIGITAGIENTAPKPEWVEGLNRMDMNIAVSEFVKDVFTNVTYDQLDDKGQRIGVVRMNKPMEVLFEGVDTDVYKKTNEFSKELVDEMSTIPEKFLFLYTGHWLQGNLGQDRKDTGMLVKTFLETFKNKKNPPALLMKTSGATFSVIDRRSILGKIKEIKDTIKGDLPNVYLLHGDMTDDEINELYNHPKVKAHITFTHGEGFGRPLLEASMSEKPIIAPDWSGQKDFLNTKNAILLPGTLIDVHSSAIPKEMLQEGAKWFAVNYQYAAQMMTRVFKNYKQYTLPAKRLGISNRGNFSLKGMNKKFESILDKHLPKFESMPQPVELKLPKLKKVSTNTPKKMELPKLKKVK